MQKIKYISNRELLIEISRSKASYCYFTSPEYANYDVIVSSVDDITPNLVITALQAKAIKRTKTGEHGSDSVVFRVMCDTHLPLETDEKRRKKSSAGEWVSKTNFSPFQHFIYNDNTLIEVGRSHWRGDLDSGVFCTAHGKISDRLAGMFMLMVDRYSRGGSWRGYSYVDEMRCHALLQLSQVGLQFDESRSDNPFSFYTQIVKNCISGDTLILTHEFGSIAIKQVADQDVHLLDGNGAWVLCHIYDYGIQETVKVNFFGDHHIISVRSTMDHGWIQHDTKQRIETKDFIDQKNIISIDDLINPRNQWEVFPKRQSFEKRMERVYCPDVPTTHSFALASGIHSCNCFRRILNLERRNQDIRDDLLLMSGAQPSYTRQIDNEFDQRDEWQKASMSDVHVVGNANRSDPEANLIKKRRGRKPRVLVDS